MADIKWIKITTDMFDNRKIKHLRRLPDGDSIVLIWVMLLTLAGRCNSGGMIFLTENIPYTPKMLADELDFEESTVQLALNALEQLGMINTDVQGFLEVTGWAEYQNIEGLDKIREENRIRKQKQREKQKLIPSQCHVMSRDSHAMSRDSHATEEDKKEEKELEYNTIITMFNSICSSLPSVRSLSDARKKAIKARLKTYTVDDFKTVFENAEASSFLKGQNNKNWNATFDWLIADKNMAKVLDGNYADKTAKTEQKPSWMQNKAADPIAMDSIRRLMEEPDEDITEQAEQLKQKMQLKYGGVKNG